MAATAGPARRFLLVQVNGPWGRSGLLDSRLDRYYAGRLAQSAELAGVRVLLVRRPGRHAAQPNRELSAVALVDVSAGRAAVRWGSWLHPKELLDVDLTAAVVPEGQQDVALVCTHGRHDLCCAVRGRPVADALAAGSGLDVWECGHLGGDRFAASVLLLPSGDLFGGLDGARSLEVVAAHGQGRVVVEHYRGRFGTAQPVQAAVHHLLERLGPDLPGGVDAVRVRDVRRVDDDVVQGWLVDAMVGTTRYRLRLEAHWSTPARLTCGSAVGGRVRTLVVVQEAAEPVDTAQ